MNTTENKAPEITLLDVAQSIGWLDAMNDGDLEFGSVDWSQVTEGGVVTMEGRKGDLLVAATIQITEVTWQRDYDNAGWDDNED